MSGNGQVKYCRDDEVKWKQVRVDVEGQVSAGQKGMAETGGIRWTRRQRQGTGF